MNNISKYPTTFYRVTVKAIIRNEQGRVLAVKEGSNNWGLPGGGVDHGETLERALAREMYEEALITQAFSSKIIGTDVLFVVDKEVYLMWIVCELEFKSAVRYGIGADARDVAFVDPKLYKKSIHRSERLLYKWCVEKHAKE